MSTDCAWRIGCGNRYGPRERSAGACCILYLPLRNCPAPCAGRYEAGPMLRYLDGRRRLGSKHTRASWVIVWNNPQRMW